MKQSVFISFVRHCYIKIYRKQRQIHKTQTSIKSLLQTRSTWHSKFRPYWRRLKTKSLQQQYRAERRSNYDATAIFEE